MQALNSHEMHADLKGIYWIGWVALLILLITSIIVYFLVLDSYNFVTKNYGNQVLAPDICQRVTSIIMYA